MNKESIFSEEYGIDNMTDSLSSNQKDISATKDETEASKIIKQIESEYDLSKPRRKIIRAKIIP